MRKITLLNGPNLNLLGLREPDRYGIGTLAEIVAECTAFSSDNGFDLDSFQSNSEADLINHIHSAIDDKIEGEFIIHLLDLIENESDDKVLQPGWVLNKFKEFTKSNDKTSGAFGDKS